MSYVSISGNIASGKSTLLDALMDEGYSTVPEDLGDDFLDLLDSYNKDPSTAIDLQNYINDYRWADAQHSYKASFTYVHERCIADDIVFTSVMAARGEISQQDADVFMDKALSRLAENPPRKIIYLYCHPEIGFERMRNRGRAEETGQNLLRIAELEEAHLRLLPLIADQLNIGYVEMDWTNYGSVIEIIKELGK